VAVIAGASGFIGGELIAALRSDGYLIRTIGRSGADVAWDDPAGIRRVVDGADLLVNLAGKSVGCRYTDANRDEILRSRVETTRELNAAVAAATDPPALWLNASTGTIYRYATDRAQTERAGELGAGFSVDVATNWEAEFFAGELPRTRRVALRMAIVLGDGTATRQIFRAARLGLGGPNYDGWWPQHRRYRGIGPTPSGGVHAPAHTSRGEQRFSWIHIDDLIGAVRFIRSHPEITGPVNLSAPVASDNRTLMAAVRRRVRMPVGIPTYRWMLEIGMVLLRKESELLLKSRWVAPELLLEAGFRFRYTDLDDALRSL